MSGWQLNVLRQRSHVNRYAKTPRRFFGSRFYGELPVCVGRQSWWGKQKVQHEQKCDNIGIAPQGIEHQTQQAGSRASFPRFFNTGHEKDRWPALEKELCHSKCLIQKRIVRQFEQLL